MPPLTPIERRTFNYNDHAHCMAQMDQAIRYTRGVLAEMTKPMLRK